MIQNTPAMPIDTHGTPTAFQQRHAAVCNSLNACGVGENLAEKLREDFAAITAFATRLHESASNQAVYDRLTNVPTGILTPEACEQARHALIGGLVSAIGQLVSWDVVAALDISARIAEDVNAHTEAAAIWKMQKELTT